VLGGLAFADRVRPSDRRPDVCRNVLRRQLVDVEQEIEVRVEVGVAAPGGADDDRGPKRHQFKRRGDHSAREAAEVLRWPPHPVPDRKLRAVLEATHQRGSGLTEMKSIADLRHLDAQFDHFTTPVFVPAPLLVKPTCANVGLENPERRDSEACGVEAPLDLGH
jgi:hypothetical protein